MPLKITPLHTFILKKYLRRDTSANLDLLKDSDDVICRSMRIRSGRATVHAHLSVQIAPDDNDPVLIFYRAKNQHRQGNYEEASTSLQ